MGFFKKIISSILNASIPIYKFEDNKLYFKLELEDYFEYELDNYDMKTRHDSFVNEAYTLNTDDIFLEYVSIDSNANWNGEALSLYEGFIKLKLHIKSLDLLEKKEISNYTFKTYKVDDSFVFHIINISTVSSEVFIIDMKGNLYKNLLKKLDKNYVYEYDNNQKGSVNFNISLVKENCVKGFFNGSD